MGYLVWDDSITAIRTCSTMPRTTPHKSLSLPSTEHWNILGAGAMGCLWACRLQAAGQPVSLILSPERALKEAGAQRLVVVRRVFAPRQAPASHSLEIAGAAQVIHRVLVATKAQDVLPALLGIADRLAPNATLVTLSNGMGYHNDVLQAFPGQQLFALSSTDGAFFSEPGQLVFAGRGYNRIAALSGGGDSPERGDSSSLARALSTPGHAVHARKNAQSMLLAKLSINACINALTAIEQCRNGELLTRPTLKKRLNALIAEIELILVACSERRLAKTLANNVHQVAQATSANYSSSCSDIRAGRKSELEYINGYLLTLAEQHGINAPLNTELMAQIRNLETETQRP